MFRAKGFEGSGFRAKMGSGLEVSGPTRTNPQGLGLPPAHGFNTIQFNGASSVTNSGLRAKWGLGLIRRVFYSHTHSHNGRHGRFGLVFWSKTRVENARPHLDLHGVPWFAGSFMEIQEPAVF